MRRLPRTSRAYRYLRLGRNAASNLRHRTRDVHPTAFVHRSARVAPDLRAQEYAFVGPDCRLGAGVSIGRYAMLAAGVSIVGDDHEWRVPGVPTQFAGRPAERATQIGPDAWLGDGATVMAGVRIGEGAIVAARAVVTKDVPVYEVWAGVPARRIDTRFEGEERARHSAAINGPIIDPSFAGPRDRVRAASEALAEDSAALGTDRRRHLCILTTAHPLDDVRVYTKIARSYLDAGWKVTWVGPDHSFFAGTGFRAPGIDYVFTPAPSGRRDRIASARRVARAARAVHDVDWWYSPDPDAAAVAVRTAARQGGRVVFDIHEEFHGSMLDRWTFGRPVALVREAVRRRVRHTCGGCDLVIGVNDSVLAPFVPPGVRHFTVRNCAPRWFADRFSPHAAGPAAPAPGAADSRPLFMHGKALPGNGTPVVIDALREAEGVRVLMFPGRGPAAGPHYLPSLDADIAAAGVADQLVLHDAVTHEQMPAVMADCSAGLIAYGRALGEASLPNRIFEYMAAGLAVLVPSYAREIVAIVEAEDIGLTVDFEDPHAVAAQLRRLRDDPEGVARMGARAREAFVARHCWEVEFAALLDATS